MITRSFAKHLLSNSAITSVTTEIKPLKLEDGHDDPAIVYGMSNDRKINLIDGFSTMARADFDVDCYSQSYNQAKDLAAIVTGQLSGYVGTMGDHQSEQIAITDEQDLFEDDTKLYRVAMRFAVWYLS